MSNLAGVIDRQDKYEGGIDEQADAGAIGEGARA
jgi:hypothetical protein